MSSLKVRNVEIGKGIPKIIAPICDKTEEEILIEYDTLIM